MHEAWKRMCIGIFSALALSCSEEATQDDALVSPVPLEAVTFSDTTIQSISGTTFKQFSSMDGPANLVGRSGDYIAYTPIQFYPSYFPFIDTINVISALLRVNGASWFGDSTSDVGFTVHRIERSWSPATLTWDSVQSGFYDAGTVRGRYSGPVGNDTAAMQFDLDTSMVREWLATPTSTTTTKYGIVLVPTSATRVVRGLASFDDDSVSRRPTLTVITVNVAGTVRDTMSFSLGNDTFVGNIDNLNTRSDLFYLQAGVVYRSVIKFDVSFLPRGATIHNAELQLDREPSTCKLNRFSGDSAIAAHLARSESDNSAFESFYTAGRLLSGSTTTYSVDTRRAVQSWLRGPNYGLILRVGSAREFSSFDLLTFYTVAAANPASRPRLKIIYSTVN